MILTPESRIRDHVASGAWTRETVDDLIRAAVAAVPDRTAVMDAGTVPVPGVSARYSYAEMERRVAGLAGFLAGVGLKPDTVVGIHLPPCADAAIVMLAALRAGLVVAPLPLHWSNGEIETAIGVAGIKAIVTASSVESDLTGERMRDVAAEVFAIRFVFALGEGLPDGLIDLAAVMAEIDAFPPVPGVARRGEAADHIALLSFARTGDDRLCAVPFSHSHVVALARAHMAEAGASTDDVLLVPMHPASLPGFAGGLLGALATGGTVAYHYGQTLGGIAGAAAETGATRVVAPVALGPALAAVLEPGVGLSLADRRVAGGTGARIGGGRPVVDLLSFGDVTLLPRLRGADGRPAAIPAGPVRAAGSDAVLAELRTKGRTRVADSRRTPAELTLSGPLVPDTPWPEPMSGNAGGVLAFTSDGSLRTGLNVIADPDGGSFDMIGPAHEIAMVAGHPLSLPRLDALVRRHPGVADAAVFPIPDGLIGARIGVAVVPRPGTPLSLQDLTDWLATAGVGPLERPSALVPVPVIARTADGGVQRQSLLLERVA